jgi:hypothetical protein
MRQAKTKRAEPQDPGAGTAVAGAEFLLSIVEHHNTRGNGNGLKMESGLKARQELDKIEEQIARLEKVDGQGEETRREIRQLHERVDELRREVTSQSTAWERTNLARHPQRPYTLDYIDRIFTDWSEIHGDRGFRDDPGDCLRDGTLSRRGSDRDWPAEGARREAARVSKFWNAAS